MRRSEYLYSILLLLLSAGACKVSRDIPRPADAAPPAFRNAALPAADNSIADLPYREFFGEKLLTALIDSALVHNYDMQIAVKNLQSAEVLFRQAGLAELPALNLQVTANTSRPSDNSLNGLTISQFAGTRHIEDYSASAGLSWEADIWRKIASQKSLAGANYLQSAEAKKAIQTRLISTVAQGFYKLIMLDTQLEIAKKNLALNDSTLHIINMQFTAGQVSSLAIDQARAQQLVAAGLVPQLQQEINVEENALSILAGRFPGAIARNGLLDAFTVRDQMAAGIPSSLLSLRPDVKSAELELVKANARAGITKAALYPSLTITASGGINSFRSSNWFNIPGSLFGLAAGGIAQPIFQHRQLRAQYEVALLEREKNVLQFRQSVLVAAGEVADELIRIAKLKEQFVVAGQRVQVVQRSLKNADLLFQSGMANYLEVITAQRNALQSELDLAMIKTAQLNAGVELYRALGGGWK